MILVSSLLVSPLLDVALAVVLVMVGFNRESRC